MSVITQTYNSNDNYGERRARWTVEFNFSDITVSGSSFVFNTPVINAKFQPLTMGHLNAVKPRYGYAMFATPNTTWPAGYYDPDDEPISRTSASIGGVPISSGTDHDGWLWNRPTPSDEYYRYELWFPSESNIKPTYKTLDKKNYVYTGSGGQKTNTHTITLNTSDFFTSDNKSLRSLNVVFNFAEIFLAATDIYPGESATGGYITDAIVDDNMTADYYFGYDGEAEGFSQPLSYIVGTVTLDVPPDIIPGTPSTGALYENVSSYTVPITSADAYYDGDVTSITLTVGADSTIKTYSSPSISIDSISVTPSNAGTYTPTLTVEDSRGQTKTVNLPSITVNSYTRPSVSFDVFRSDQYGIKNDEGHYGLIKAKFDYVSAIANLTVPTVIVTNSSGQTVSGVTTTWYSSYITEASGATGVTGATGSTGGTTQGVSNPISNWSTVAANQQVYGLIDADFSESDTYQITIIETDTQDGVSEPISQALSTAYYTIDFKAGGKEISFGAPANDDLTDINNKDYSEDGLFKCRMGTSFNDMSVEDLQTLVNNLTFSGGISVDWIVEEGTSGVWTYRKYNSGIAECWGYYDEGSIAFSNLWTYAYYSAQITRYLPTNLFVSTPVVASTCESNAGLNYITLIESNKTYIKYYITSSKAETRTCYTHFHILGRWKT